MLDTTEMYILILAYLTMTRIQDLREAKRQKFCTNYQTFSMDMDGIWYAVETCCSNEPLTHLISSDQYSRDFLGLHLDVNQLTSFKLNMNIDTTKLYILIHVWITWTYVQGHRYMRKQNGGGRGVGLQSLSHKFPSGVGVDLMCCYDLMVCSSLSKFFFTWVVFKWKDST